MLGALVFVVSASRMLTTRAQVRGELAAGSHVTIPYLANAQPDAIDFAAAECDIDRAGDRMACRFRQVFVTVASIDATACVISTNGYEQTFQRVSPSRWVATSAPAGLCGIVDTTTLEDGGGTRWTMTIGKSPTRNVDRAECRAVQTDAEIYRWQDLKRKLPCATIQPGAIER